MAGWVPGIHVASTAKACTKGVSYVCGAQVIYTGSQTESISKNNKIREAISGRVLIFLSNCFLGQIRNQAS